MVLYVSEPFRLRMTPAEIASHLRNVHFIVESDESSVEWGTRYLGAPVASVGERLVVARLSSR